MRPKHLLICLSLLALILPSRSTGQTLKTYRSKVDPRFTLNVTLKDTTVTQPYSTFLASAAKTTVRDTLIEEKAANIGRLHGMLNTKEQEVIELRAANDALKDSNFKLQLDLQEEKEELIECAAKRERLKVWGTIGKFTIYGAVGVSALLLYTKIIVP
jgi:hypothetical protein